MEKPGMTISGRVERKRVGVGSKFERDALCLVSPDGDYLLRRPGVSAAPDFVDPDLDALAGKQIRVNGTVNASRSTLFVSHWEEDT